MDSDRKSTVSSFYGARKNSLDALNHDFPPTSADAGRRSRHDSSSSFYNPEPARGSFDALNSGQPNAAGYNRGSFFHTGREEPIKGGRDEEEDVATPRADAGWDVFADFNNAGPRYSNAFGAQTSDYHALDGTTPKADGAESTLGPTEMVTVPALGAEWNRAELRDMTKAGKRERKKETRAQKYQEWKRGNGRFFTRKIIVWVCFCLIIIIAIIIGVCIPRVPGFAFNDTNPLAPATGAFNKSIVSDFSIAPANFSFPALCNLQLNTQSNNLPVKFKSIDAKVFDLDTNRQIGTGNLGGFTVPAKAFPLIQLPLNFTYSAGNSSDPTYQNWYTGCKNKSFVTGGVRAAVKFRLVLVLSIFGLPGTYGSSSSISDAACPIELSPNHA